MKQTFEDSRVGDI